MSMTGGRGGRMGGPGGLYALCMCGAGNGLYWRWVVLVWKNAGRRAWVRLLVMGIPSTNWLHWRRQQPRICFVCVYATNYSQ